MDQCDGHPMRINLVVLNYKDAETVGELIRMVQAYDYLEKIVVVDNMSPDNSYEELLVLENEKVSVIRTEKNGGYGYGNNAGIRYAVEQNGATHVLVANPDVVFSEQCVIKMAKMFQKHPDTGIVAASMVDEEYGEGVHNGWPLHGFWGELLSMGPISRRVFGRWLRYPKTYFQGRKAVYVDAVHGSMVLISARAFADSGGYDEGIFLYQEEAVLGMRMKTAGYRTVLLLNQSYQHHHSVSISKSYDTLAQRQKLRNDSVLYYMKNYLYINPVEEWIARLWFKGILLEDKLAAMVLSEKNK